MQSAARAADGLSEMFVFDGELEWKRYWPRLRRGLNLPLPASGSESTRAQLTAVEMHGDVEAGDGAKFQQVLDYRASKGLWTEWLTVNSSGGNTYAGWGLSGACPYQQHQGRCQRRSPLPLSPACFKDLCRSPRGRVFHPEASSSLACIPRQRATSTAMIFRRQHRRARCRRRDAGRRANIWVPSNADSCIIAKLISTEPEDMAFLPQRRPTSSAEPSWATCSDDDGIDQKRRRRPPPASPCRAEEALSACELNGSGSGSSRSGKPVMLRRNRSHHKQTMRLTPVRVPISPPPVCSHISSPNHHMEFSNGKEVSASRTGAGSTTCSDANQKWA